MRKFVRRGKFVGELHHWCGMLLPTRVCNVLRKAGVKTRGQLVKFQALDLLSYRNFGVDSLSILMGEMDRHGLSFVRPRKFSRKYRPPLGYFRAGLIRVGLWGRVRPKPRRCPTCGCVS